MIRLPGVSPIMSCSRVKESVSPSFSAASVATIRNRVGTWISGASASSVMAYPSGALLPGDGGGGSEEHEAQADAGDGPRPSRSREQAYGADDGDREGGAARAPVCSCRHDARPGQAGDEQWDRDR